MSFSYDIKAIRQNSLLSQEAFAQVLGVSFTTVNRWEAGKSKPSYKTMKLIDQPVNENYSVEWLTERLCSFKGDLIVQTIFLRGEHDGKTIDNTTAQEVDAWVNALKTIQPKQVMIYAIDRATPVKTLEKVSKEELEQIADKARNAGFTVSVAG